MTSRYGALNIEERRERDQRHALQLRAEGIATVDIARVIRWTPQRLGNFFARHLKAEKTRELAQQQHEAEEAARREALAADRDYVLIASLWTRGVAVYAILARVNRDRKARGLKAMETAELHALVVKHGLCRPDAARPRMAA